MNHHKNGTISVGAPGSYQNLLSGLKDLMKGRPKVFEVYHHLACLRKAGERIGLTSERMHKDIAEAQGMVAITEGGLNKALWPRTEETEKPEKPV